MSLKTTDAVNPNNAFEESGQGVFAFTPQQVQEIIDRAAKKFAAYRENNPEPPVPHHLSDNEFYACLTFEATNP